MRYLLLSPLLLLAACGRDTPDEQRQTPEASTDGAAQPSALAVFAAGTRDRLCLDERNGRAGLIAYGEGRNNCSLSGSVERSGSALTISPDGDLSCRVQATVAGDSITLGEVGGACAYYCGPSVSLDGRTFGRMEAADPVTDLAGDPLC